MRLPATWLDELAVLAGRRLDLAYAALVHQIGLAPGFFKKGWGDLQAVGFEDVSLFTQGWPPQHFDIKPEWTVKRRSKVAGVDCELLEASFRTPCFGRVYDALPAESRTARAQLLQPCADQARRALVVHLAGTGDQDFARRLGLGSPLVQQGIASLVLESPYYGARRPQGQRGSKLLHVSDLLTLGRATIEESLFLLAWAQQQGLTRLGMCGLSMGGVHASMTASLFPGPVACTPLLAPRSAAVAFCHGALAHATAWNDLMSERDARHRPVEEVLRVAGQPAQGLITAARILDTVGGAQQQAAAVAGQAADSPAQSHGSADTAAQASTARVRDALLQGSQRLRQAASGEQASREAEPAQRQEQQEPRQSGDSFSRQRNSGISQAEAQLGELHRVQETISREQARMRLYQVLETYTDVTRFPRLQCPQAAVLVAAENDAYVSRQSVLELSNHWPGCEVRWVKGGHVSAFLLRQGNFRCAIADSIARLPAGAGQPAAAAVQPAAAAPA